MRVNSFADLSELVVTCLHRCCAHICMQSAMQEHSEHMFPCIPQMSMVLRCNKHQLPSLAHHRFCAHHFAML